MQGSHGEQSLDAGSSGRPDHEGNSGRDSASVGHSSKAAAKHSAQGEAMGSSMLSAACSDMPAMELQKRRRSRVTALAGQARAPEQEVA